MPDWDFIEEFLITFRYFTVVGSFANLRQLISHAPSQAPDDLLTRLIERYHYELPTSLSDTEREERLKWKGPVQLRVINILKKWIESHFYDFANSNGNCERARISLTCWRRRSDA